MLIRSSAITVLAFIPLACASPPQEHQRFVEAHQQVATDSHPLRFQPGFECKYTEAELEQWRRAFLVGLNKLSGVTMATGYLARLTTCYFIGIESDSVRPLVERELMQQGIPLDAVEIVVATITFD